MNEEQASVLIIDDNDPVKKLLYGKLTGKGYRCYQAASAEQVLSQLKNNPVDVVLLDMDMPGVSGVELLPRIKAESPNTSILTVTAVGGTGVGIESLKLGASQYITKPLILEEAIRVVGMTMEKRRLELLTKAYQQHLEDKVGELGEKIRGSLLNAVTSLAHALEAKDKYTSGHSYRVANLSVAIGNQMCLPQESVKQIDLAGLVHDIGKIGIMESILNKPASLAREEFQQIQNHPEIGEHILLPVVTDNQILELVRNHHERYDGNGYPDRLKNDEIPLGARILAVSDAYDAMTSERPYRKAMTNEEAFVEIEQGEGTQFAPEVVAALHRLRKSNSPSLKTGDASDS